MGPPWTRALAPLSATLLGCSFTGVGGGDGSAGGDAGTGATGSGSATTSDPTLDAGPPPTTSDGSAASDSDTTEGVVATATSQSDTATASGTSMGDGSSGDSGGLPTGPFGEPQRIDELSDAAAFDDDPTLRFDELEIIFNSDREGGDMQIFVATRAGIDLPWDVPEVVDELSFDLAGDTTPELSLDGLSVVIASDRPPAAAFDYWVSTRSSLNASWSTPVAYPALSSPDVDFGATPVSDTVVYLCTNRPGGAGVLDVWRVDDADVVNLLGSAPINDAPLNGPGEDCTVTTSSDQLEIFWERRADMPLADWEIWTATRRGVDEPWVDLAPAESLNSGLDDNDPWLSPDGHRMYFSSSREGAFDLYVAQR